MKKHQRRKGFARELNLDDLHQYLIRYISWYNSEMIQNKHSYSSKTWALRYCWVCECVCVQGVSLPPE